jgi:chorismate synthase
MALVLMDHALLHRAQNADVSTPTPKLAGVQQHPTPLDGPPSSVKHNPIPDEA